jgi:HK97 family phage major capsid protein
MKTHILRRSAAAKAAARRDFNAFKAKVKASSSLYEKREAPTLDLKAIGETITAIQKTFEEFKKANDESLAELKKSGCERPETREKIAKIEADLNKYEDIKSRLEKVETRAARPGGTSLPGEKREATKAQLEHREAFVNYMRDPNDQALLQRMQETWKDRLAEMAPKERRAVETIAPALGGLAVPEIIDREVTRLGRDIAGINSIVRVVNVGSADYKRLFDVGGQASGWVGEKDARTETATSSIAEIAPTFGTVYAYPKATEEALNDMFFDVESWLVESGVEGFDYEEELAIVSGSGVKKPTGFLAGPAPTAVTDKAGTRPFGTLQYMPSGFAAAMPTNPDTFIDMVQGTRAKYRRNGMWVANSLTIGAMRKYKSGTGEYLWEQSIKAGTPNTFLNYGVMECESMPDVGAGAFPVAFGDFREGYVLARINGLRITRDEVTEPGYVKWYMRRRVGGKIGNSQAIKLLKIAAT